MRSLFGLRFSLFVAALFVATAADARAGRCQACAAGARRARSFCRGCSAGQSAAVGVRLRAARHAAGAGDACLRRMMDRRRRCRAARASSRSRRFATVLVRRIGIRAIIRRCLRSWREAARTAIFARARCATIPTEKGAPKTRRSRDCRCRTSCSRWHDYRDGTRKSADPKKGNTNAMIAIAKAMTDEEIHSVGPVFRIDEVDAVDQGRRKRHRAEDAHRRRSVCRPAWRRDRAARQSHHRDARRQRTRSAARSALGLRRVRAGRRHQKRRGAREDRRRQDDGVRDLPWRRSEGAGTGARPCWTFAELQRAPDVRHAGWRAQRAVGRPDEAGRGEADGRRLCQYFGLHRGVRWAPGGNREDSVRLEAWCTVSASRSARMVR